MRGDLEARLPDGRRLHIRVYEWFTDWLDQKRSSVRFSRSTFVQGYAETYRRNTGLEITSSELLELRERLLNPDGASPAIGLALTAAGFQCAETEERDRAFFYLRDFMGAPAGLTALGAACVAGRPVRALDSDAHDFARHRDMMRVAWVGLRVASSYREADERIRAGEEVRREAPCTKDRSYNQMVADTLAGAEDAPVIH